MSIELIVFDLGRVLVKLCDGWQHACEVAGVGRPADIDAARSAKVMELVCASEVGKLELDDFLKASAPLLGIPLDHMRALSDAYLLGTYPGVIELLKELRQAGLMTACLSNTNANHWRLMNEVGGANFGTLEHLDYQFASHLIRLRKPDPRIYEHVERESGIKPAGIVFFDDIEENVAAARQRGWTAYRIAVGPDPIQQIRAALREWCCRRGLAG